MAELVIKIGDSPNGSWRDGQIVHAWTNADIAAQWAEAVKRHPETWGKVADRSHSPMSGTMLKEFFVLSVANMHQDEKLQLEGWVERIDPKTGDTETVREPRVIDYRKFVADIGESLADVQDKQRVVDLRAVEIDRTRYLVARETVRG